MSQSRRNWVEVAGAVGGIIVDVMTPSQLTMTRTNQLTITRTGQLTIARTGQLTITRTGQLTITRTGQLAITRTGQLTITTDFKMMTNYATPIRARQSTHTTQLQYGHVNQPVEHYL